MAYKFSTIPLTMTTQYILSIIESAITRIDGVTNTDDISSLILRLEYLNRQSLNFGGVGGVSHCAEIKRRKTREIQVEEQQQENDVLSASAVDDHEDLVSGVLDQDIASLYYLELQISQHSIIVLDKAGTEFFLRDFNLKSNTLWLGLVRLASHSYFSPDTHQEPSSTDSGAASPPYSGDSYAR
ncbi:hypothetical protein OS493_006127 [Desmophyllum pertusum]|uniref:Uncharacterized protein n=1 Tax=Desmophyllum pertusum TaxID=174260 RepID=A0A9X0DB42_9CNID|nr:hypothetical protein OS493_006127 [Desmophyllum pertusum]